MSVLSYVYMFVQYVYLHGPSLNGYGFWQGVPNADICAQLTGAGSTFWASSSAAADECDVLIQRHVHALYITVMCAALVATMYTIIHAVTGQMYAYVMWQRPIYAQMEALQKRLDMHEQRLLQHKQ